MPTTARVFIIRHGETEWSLNGRHTGTTDIPLTANGERRIIATGDALVGRDRLIVPANLAHVYVSPRQRAKRTLELLGLGCRAALPWQTERGTDPVRCEATVQVSDAVREWDYGDYEGLTSAEIRAARAEAGLHAWDIWRDGCPGGESPEQVEQRLDALIAEIRSKFHAPAMAGAKPGPCDVLIVAHGHISRAFAARWVNRSVAGNPSLILETGGVGILSYEHDSIDEPALVLGGAFTVPEK